MIIQFIFSIFVFSLLVIFYLQKKLAHQKLANCAIKQKDKIFFSVIIAAKNESANLNSLFGALNRLNYPSHLYEIIFVDDDSEDHTFTDACAFKENIPQLTVIHTNHLHPGKRGALATGIDKARSEFIVITDADCFVEQNWLHCLSDRFSANNDFIIGVSPIQKGNSLISKIAAYDYFRSYSLAFSLAQAGLPYSAVARNFAFRKSVFYKIGGFSFTLQSLGGDDDLLLREAVKNKCRIGLMNAKESFVFTPPPPSFSAYMRQKARHTATSGHYLLSHKLILGSWHCMNIFAQYSYVYFFVHPLLPLMFPIKLLYDCLFTHFFQKRYGYSFTLLECLYLPFIYEWLLMHHYFNSRKKNLQWK